MSKIFSIFFLFALFFMASELSGAVPAAPGLTLFNDISGDDARYLRKVIRQLDRYARAAKIERRKENYLIICGEGDYCGVYGKNRLYLPGDASIWRYDPDLRRKVYGALAAHRLNYNFEAGSPGLAHWMVNGIDAELAAAESSGQFLTANRRYLLLSELSGISGKLPQFAAMTRIGIGKNRGMDAVSGEQARLLLHILAADKKIAPVFAESCAGAAPDNFMRHYGSNRSAADERLNELALNFLWNKYSPMPGELLLKALKAMETRTVPELNKKNQFTGNYISCSWKEFAALFDVKRPDGEQLKDAASREFRKIARRTTAREQALCNSIAAVIGKFGVEEDAFAEFEKLLDELKAAVNRRIQCDIFLKDTMMIHGSLPDRFQTLFEMLELYSPALGEAEAKFFHRILNDYLR